MLIPCSVLKVSRASCQTRDQWLTALDLNPLSTPFTITKSDCTSCKVKEDMSNYWTPLLYFMGDDGTFTEVQTVGGMLA